MAPDGTCVPLRGRSGRLYGILDLATLTIAVRRGGQGEPLETIDLRPILIAAGVIPDDERPTISPL